MPILSRCTFCSIAEREEVLFKTRSFVFVKSKNKIESGHCLLITKKHIIEEIKMSNEIWVNYKTASRKASDYMVSSTKIKPFVFINPPQMQSVGHFHKHYVTGKFGVHGVATALRSFLKNKS